MRRKAPPRETATLHGGDGGALHGDPHDFFSPLCSSRASGDGGALHGDPHDPRGLRYHAFSDYLRRRYGRRIQKIPLDAGFGCPHRAGPDHRGEGGCSYCRNDAFSPASGTVPPLLGEQLAAGIRQGRKRARAGGFFAYFQAYTNTFAPPETLRQRYDTIRSFPEIVGLAVGTRPDCLEEEGLDLLESFCRDYEVWVEIGLQSANDATLERIRRGHTVEDFLDAVERAARRGLNICAHVILGLPGEGHAEMMASARLLAGLPIQGVKVHHCHVIRETPLAEEWRRGSYRPLAYEEYLSCVCDFLERIPWPVTIQRLVGDAPEGLLLAPRWGRDKAAILRDIQGELARRESRQGGKCGGSFPA